MSAVEVVRLLVLLRLLLLGWLLVWHDLSE